MSTPIAAILTQSPRLAAALADGLEERGFRAIAGARGDLVLVDADLPSAGPGLIASLRRSSPGAYVVAVTGWWDVRESELRPEVDFVLNTPPRAWQLRELAEEFERRAVTAEVRVA